MKYSYSFYVWIVTPSSKFSNAFISLLEMINTRFEVDMTEDEFRKFHYDLLLDGIQLKEITRIPYNEPEIVT